MDHKTMSAVEKTTLAKEARKQTYAWLMANCAPPNLYQEFYRGYIFGRVMTLWDSNISTSTEQRGFEQGKADHIEYDQVEAGTHVATFKGTTTIKATGYNLLLWKFDVDGKQVNGITGTATPTINNKLGKFLSGVSNLPLKEGTEFNDINQYIGNKYLIVVERKENKSHVMAFTRL